MVNVNNFTDDELIILVDSLVLSILLNNLTEIDKEMIENNTLTLCFQYVTSITSDDDAKKLINKHRNSIKLYRDAIINDE